jgi:hypothetical protein
MTSYPRVFATDHMPERKDVTADLERRFKEQEEKKAAAKARASSQHKETTSANQ